MTGRWEAIKIAARAAWKAWCKARPIPVKFVAGIANPTVARMDTGKGDPEQGIPQDVDALVLYRDQYGGFATDTQIRLGLKRLQGPFVYAQGCNHEVAEALVDELEPLSFDGALTPAEEALLVKLKKNLAERDV